MTKIQFQCGACGQVHEVPEAFSGRKGRCPRCKTVLRVERGVSHPYRSSTRRRRALLGTATTPSDEPPPQPTSDPYLAAVCAATPPGRLPGQGLIYQGRTLARGSTPTRPAQPALPPPPAPAERSTPAPQPAQPRAAHETPAAPIDFSCVHCGAQGRVPGECGGMLGRCHRCRQTLRIPVATRATFAIPNTAKAEASSSAPTELEILPAVERKPQTPLRGLKRPESTAPGPQRARRSGSTPQRISKAHAAREHRHHEEHLRAIAVWSYVAAAGALLGLGVVVILGVVLGATVADSRAGAVVAALMIPAVFASAASAGINYALGWGLWNYHTWARWVFGIFAVVGLISVAGGLLNTLFLMFSGESAVLVAAALFSVAYQGAWSGAQLWALTVEPASQIFSDDYRQVVASTGHVKIHWASSPLFSVPLRIMLVGAALVLLGLLLTLAFAML